MKSYLNMDKDQLRNQLDYQFYDQVNINLRFQLYKSFKSQLNFQFEGELDTQLYTQCKKLENKLNKKPYGKN